MSAHAFWYDWGGWNAALFWWINQATPMWLDPVAWAGSWAGDYRGTPLLLALIAAAAFSARRAGAQREAEARAWLARQFVVASLLAWPVMTALKHTFDFPRPLAVFPSGVHVIGPPELHFSLPSGHAAYAAMAATVLWPMEQRRRFKVLLLGYVAWVVWSRVAAGAHFPVDVLAGLIVGVLIAAVVNRVIRPDTPFLQRRSHHVVRSPR